MEDGKAAVAAARQWRAAAALAAIVCLALLGLQAHPPGLSLRLLAVPTTNGLIQHASGQHDMAAVPGLTDPSEIAADAASASAAADVGMAAKQPSLVVTPAAPGESAAGQEAAAAGEGTAAASGTVPAEGEAGAGKEGTGRAAAASPHSSSSSSSSSKAGPPPGAASAGEAGAAAAVAALPSAADGAPSLPSCLANALLQPGDVGWTALNGSVDQLFIRGCPLRRFSHAEAAQCLAGKRLVFVGDSITRYQYLTLLHFLDRGEWPHPTGNQPGQPSVTNEHEWPSWNAFLRGTSRLFGGREQCDCYREDLFQYFDPRFKRMVTWKPPEEEKFENRHYRSGNISVSHLTFTSEPNTVHGHFGFPPYEKGRKPCKPASCRAAADWSYHLTGALRQPIAEMEPTHLVLNSGLWGSSNAFGDKLWRDIARAGRAAVAAQQGRVIWRTTTASLGKDPVGRDHDKLAVQHTTAAGWGVLDAWAITQPLVQLPPLVRPLWDPRHFTAVVYRELNQYLLNMICQPLAAA